MPHVWIINISNLSIPPAAPEPTRERPEWSKCIEIVPDIHVLKKILMFEVLFDSVIGHSPWGTGLYQPRKTGNDSGTEGFWFNQTIFFGN